MTNQSRRHKYGDRESCIRCGQDIEFHGARNWVDRGNNRQCPSYKGKDGEIIIPRQGLVHMPSRRNPQ